MREYLNQHVKPQTYGYLFHRPLSSYINFILQEGCILQHLDEPHLSQELARQLGNDKDLHVPSFIVIHATRG